MLFRSPRLRSWVLLGRSPGLEYDLRLPINDMLMMSTVAMQITGYCLNNLFITVAGAAQVLNLFPDYLYLK